MERSKVLLLSDSNGRHMFSLLQKSLRNQFSVFSFIKPGAKLKDVVDSVGVFTCNFNEHDYVLIIGGTNDVSDDATYESTIKEALNALMPISLKTNLIVTEIPRNYYKTMCKIITEANKFIKKTIRTGKKNCNFAKTVDFMKIGNLLKRSDFTRHGLHMNMKGKNKLAIAVANVIRKMKKKEIASQTLDKKNRAHPSEKKDFPRSNAAGNKRHPKKKKSGLKKKNESNNTTKEPNKNLSTRNKTTNKNKAGIVKNNNTENNSKSLKVDLGRNNKSNEATTCTLLDNQSNIMNICNNHEIADKTISQVVKPSDEQNCGSETFTITNDHQESGNVRKDAVGDAIVEGLKLLQMAALGSTGYDDAHLIRKDNTNLTNDHENDIANAEENDDIVNKNDSNTITNDLSEITSFKPHDELNFNPINTDDEMVPCKEIESEILIFYEGEDVDDCTKIENCGFEYNGNNLALVEPDYKQIFEKPNKILKRNENLEINNVDHTKHVEVNNIKNKILESTVEDDFYLDRKNESLIAEYFKIEGKSFHISLKMNTEQGVYGNENTDMVIIEKVVATENLEVEISETSETPMIVDGFTFLVALEKSDLVPDTFMTDDVITSSETSNAEINRALVEIKEITVPCKQSDGEPSNINKGTVEEVENIVSNVEPLRKISIEIENSNTEKLNDGLYIESMELEKDTIEINPPGKSMEKDIVPIEKLYHTKLEETWGRECLTSEISIADSENSIIKNRVLLIQPFVGQPEELEDTQTDANDSITDLVTYIEKLEFNDFKNLDGSMLIKCESERLIVDECCKENEEPEIMALFQECNTDRNHIASENLDAITGELGTTTNVRNNCNEKCSFYDINNNTKRWNLKSCAIM